MAHESHFQSSSFQNIYVGCLSGEGSHSHSWQSSSHDEIHQISVDMSRMSLASPGNVSRLPGPSMGRVDMRTKAVLQSLQQQPVENFVYHCNPNRILRNLRSLGDELAGQSLSLPPPSPLYCGALFQRTAQLGNGQGTPLNAQWRYGIMGHQPHLDGSMGVGTSGSSSAQAQDVHCWLGNQWHFVGDRIRNSL